MKWIITQRSDSDTSHEFDDGKGPDALDVQAANDFATTLIAADKSDVDAFNAIEENEIKRSYSIFSMQPV